MLRTLEHNTDRQTGLPTPSVDDSKTSSSSNWHVPPIVSAVVQSRYNFSSGSQPRPLRLAICSAGAAGLCLAQKILRAQRNGVLGSVEFVLFEKDDDYMGTWPANWSLKKYFKIFAQKYGVVPRIRLRQKVIAAIYDAASGSWDVTVQDLETSQMRTESYDVFAPAMGVLSNVNNWNKRNVTE
ncbi:uncharacterized protein ARMOST_12006 [Armillaria ostoyae]|uniref:FAD/NAD(P)-binding domain-containing protein n=1 Tax=Armillaria ostoyae TaxID=47428 RepID=A0A284RIQ6_ARMOS|nr:uncharacterized protein ARMOST_12006 [Armillaria ostoyae]